MRITCNRRGGFSFFGLRLTEGENIVDDDLWAATKAKLAPKYLAGLLEHRGELPAMLIELNDAGEPLLPPFNAKDTIALIESCQSLDDLAKYETGETRKTVLAAIERRADELCAAEHIEGRGQ